ncbi:hypothetical protein [Bradyrhizobium sp. 2S1]|uniref:hypothetical protein n=1 Tax=Bradyrhizobium sp. 2S1 TaxID=1404429 RepID=UPI0014080E4D|nr:hypothetical protein [Bradyrhizobium sp. 2S1]MCK7674058.1 hypothetical protein [Bradyrhizobium sp. 2S1]
MKKPNWPGIATVVAIVWIISNVGWLGIAGPIWMATAAPSPDPWIGFAGNALGAFVSLIAATVAGIAAYRTIIPMQQQLSELIRQNKFAQYDTLRTRSRELNTELTLVYQVLNGLSAAEDSLSARGLGDREIVSAAVEKARAAIQSLWKAGGNAWGDSSVVQLRKEPAPEFCTGR